MEPLRLGGGWTKMDTWTVGDNHLDEERSVEVRTQPDYWTGPSIRPAHSLAADVSSSGIA